MNSKKLTNKKLKILTHKIVYFSKQLGFDIQKISDTTICLKNFRNLTILYISKGKVATSVMWYKYRPEYEFEYELIKTKLEELRLKLKLD